MPARLPPPSVLAGDAAASDVSNRTSPSYIILLYTFAMELSAPAPDQLAIAHELERVSLWARRGAPARMSSTSITTLDTLEHSGPARITDLADIQGVTQPGMTTLVNR